ncbi:MAG: NAD-dependent epimerase/dehydratase family protein [Methylobacter sp.]|nr:NAD-dependent epimerase/dehydratase family protein [Methylobacter sp.]MDP2098672.1 NAD-dependent epimerase/dehydratase family protein [Methylobacter sp.]MDP2428942.1 NAD-dependent epimerase/dehydratase family protein [Methylobacter sp.]MDP3056136.1 NAD-dependent epimerase/dehydratase family protein [Methylobacter sp.]MDP3363473.1 NAD-dependent epimerase/dehydratase family protein [Methylobacter sp.]
MAEAQVVGLLGATSLVGECLISQLLSSGVSVSAFSRQPVVQQPNPALSWHSFADAQPDIGSIQQWVCAAPIWVLPEHFALLEASAARRVVVLSSTSRLTKTGSADMAEHATAVRLSEGEACFKAWADSKSIEWVILRPTLIYGFGRDKNIAEIARFIRRFGFFPLFGKAEGLRQPIHVQDVAGACRSAIAAQGAPGRTYNIAGGEILSYHDMVTRIFVALGRRPRLLPVPLLAFRIAIVVLRCLPRYRQWSVVMAERMNRDLVFDYGEASCDLGFEPRAFALSTEDVEKVKG